MRPLYRWWPPALAAGLLVFALANSNPAKEADQGDKAAGKKVADLVKTIINRGADINNLYSDPRGCYRFYQGALISLRAMLDDQPALQKVIDTALADAERATAPYQRALALNQALHKIYSHYHPRAREAADKAPARDGKPRDKNPKEKAPADKKSNDKVPARDIAPLVDKKSADKTPADTVKPKDKKASDKKAVDKPEKKDKAVTDKEPADKAPEPLDKKPTDKKPAPADKAVPDKGSIEKVDQTNVKGKVAFKGKPLSGGEIALVSAAEQIYTGKINADGSYTVKGLEPGEYKVTVESAQPEVPAKYTDSEKTPLTVKIRKGQNTADLKLE